MKAATPPPPLGSVVLYTPPLRREPVDIVELAAIVGQVMPDGTVHLAVLVPTMPMKWAESVPANTGTVPQPGTWRWPPK